MALIASLKTAHAIIWIEHIPHALRAVADRIMVLHFGRNVLEGPPAAGVGARIDPRVNAAVGRPLTLAVDPARFHFFDVESGISLLPATPAATEPLPNELQSAAR